MPAHLDEPDRRRRRDEAINSGLIDCADIDGNVAADRLANQGRALHDNLERDTWATHDRKYLSMLIQMHLVNVWKRYEQVSVLMVVMGLATPLPSLTTLSSSMNLSVSWQSSTMITQMRLMFLVPSISTAGTF